MTTAPLLSIGIIFKNEERCIERCLQSLEALRQAIPCELVMADTGAEDGSRAIAGKYADEVFDFPWIDDFAAARNAVMDRCSGKWYFSIDCDEWLDADITELLAFLQGKTRADAAFVIVRNYETAELEKGEAYSDFRALRLLRMSCGRRFYGAIHESFGFQETTERLTHTILHHDGYVYTDPEKKKKKMQRNMKLLRQKLEKEPEDLRTLLQCMESGRETPDFLQYVRQGVAAVQKRKDNWKIYGPCILRHAAEAARAHELPELEEWDTFAEKQFPDSIFTKVDLNYAVFLAALEKKEWEKAIRYGEGYRKGLHILRADKRTRALEEELGHSALLFGSIPMERHALVGLADAYLQSGQGEKALTLLSGLEGEKLDSEQVRITMVAFCRLHAQTALDIAPALRGFYQQISREIPDRQKQKARLATFDAVAAVPFTAVYRKEEQEREDYCRPAYTAFLALAGKCEAGRAAAVMTADSPEEICAMLAQVEDWQALPIEALEHALQAGVEFPLKEKPLDSEVLSGLAARLAHDENPARQIALALPDKQEYTGWQSLYWAQALVLAALRTFDWKLGKEDKPASLFACPEKKKWEEKRSEDTPETGLALLRSFAQVEAAMLPLIYTPQALTEENAPLLPPMHRWGLYCGLAFEALDGGNPHEYLAILHRGLKACASAKDMVQFLLDRFTEDARPKASSELLALAEKVRAILAAYGPDNPAARAIRESPAYKQVAWIIEEEPAGQMVQ